MASFNQSRLWIILCVAFTLLSGFITNLDAMTPQPIYKCLERKDCVDNIQCTNSCSFFGYKKGGICLSKTCCCYT
ncbi:unnamed protein product [Lathyrus oleraceus]